MERREAARQGTAEVAMAVTAATLTSVAVFFPMVFITGVAGQLFRDQSLTVTFALSFSLIVALTLVPMLAAAVPALELDDAARESMRRYTAVARIKDNDIGESRLQSHSLQNPTVFPRGFTLISHMYECKSARLEIELYKRYLLAIFGQGG